MHDELATLEKMKREIEWKRRIEIYIDRGEGHAWLKNPILADLVQNALMYFHGQRYLLHAWVIMPNHVHVMFTLLKGFSLESILHSWKSFTANEANKILGKQGEFWYPESFDRYIRDGEHYNRVKSISKIIHRKLNYVYTPQHGVGIAHIGVKHNRSFTLMILSVIAFEM